MGASGFAIHLESLSREPYDIDGVRRLLVRAVRSQLDGAASLRGGSIGLADEMITVGDEQAGAISFWFDDRVDWELDLAIHWVRVALASQRSRIERGLRELGCRLARHRREPYPVLAQELFGSSGLFFTTDRARIGIARDGDEISWQLPDQRPTARGRLAPAARRALARVLARGICGCPLCARRDLGYAGRDGSVRGQSIWFELERVAQRPASFGDVREAMLEVLDDVALAPVQDRGLLAERAATGFLDIGDQRAGKLSIWTDDPPTAKAGVTAHWLRLALAIGHGDVVRTLAGLGYRLGAGSEPYPTVRGEAARRAAQLRKACGCEFCEGLDASFTPDTSVPGARAQLLAAGSPQRHAFTGAVSLADRSVAISVDFGDESHVLRARAGHEPEPIPELATRARRIAWIARDGDGVAAWLAMAAVYSPSIEGYRWDEAIPLERRVWRPRGAPVQRSRPIGLAAAGSFSRVFARPPIVLAQRSSVPGAIVCSTDGGRRWREIARPPMRPGRGAPVAVDLWALARAADRPELLFCTSEHGTWCSYDAGSTFTRVKLPDGFLGEALCVGARGVVGVFGRDGRGAALARSIDGGERFGPLVRPPGARSSGPRSRRDLTFVCATAGLGETWFWGLPDRRPGEPGLFVSDDAGATWAPCARGPVHAIFPDLEDPSVVYVARPGKLVRVERLARHHPASGRAPRRS